jgi:hypothetical protein
MDTTHQAGDFYESDLEHGELMMGELLDGERFMLKLNLPAGLDYREADTLAHEIIAETADRYDGAAVWGTLTREFDNSAFALLSRKPGTTISGSPYRK